MTMRSIREDVILYVREQAQALDALARDEAHVECEETPQDDGCDAIAIYTAVGGYECTVNDEVISVHEVTGEGRTIETTRSLLTACGPPESPHYAILIDAKSRLVSRMHAAGLF